MKDFQKAMKLSLCFGAVGALLVPIVYELYANVARSFALILLAAWAVFVGIKMSSLSKRAAFLALCTDLAYTAGLGLICFIIIHPLAVRMLSGSSRYFYLKFKEQVIFIVYALLMMLLMFAACLARWGAEYARAKIRSNSDKVGEYIESAFSDSDNEGLK